MKAAVYSRYGPPDVLKTRDVGKPVPRDNEVLIRVRAASLNKADGIMLRGRPIVVRFMMSGLLMPGINILGTDVAGEVETVGKAVERFQPGDEVFGNLFKSGRGHMPSTYARPRTPLLRDLPP